MYQTFDLAWRHIKDLLTVMIFVCLFTNIRISQTITTFLDSLYEQIREISSGTLSCVQKLHLCAENRIINSYENWTKLSDCQFINKANQMIRLSLVLRLTLRLTRNTNWWYQDRLDTRLQFQILGSSKTSSQRVNKRANAYPPSYKQITNKSTNNPEWMNEWMFFSPDVTFRMAPSLLRQGERHIAAKGIDSQAPPQMWGLFKNLCLWPSDGTWESIPPRSLNWQLFYPCSKGRRGYWLVNLQRFHFQWPDLHPRAWADKGIHKLLRVYIQENNDTVQNSPCSKHERDTVQLHTQSLTDRQKHTNY